MKLLTCGIHSTDLMIQICAIRIGFNYRLLKLYPYRLSEYRLKAILVQHYSLVNLLVEQRRKKGNDG